VMLAIDGILILSMYRKAVPEARTWKKAAATILFAALVGGIVFAISELF